MGKSLKFKLIAISLFTSIVIYFGYNSRPIFMDEYASTFIIGGVDIGCFMSSEVKKYFSELKCNLDDSTLTRDKEISLKDVLKIAQDDGGNALPYYVLGYLFSRLIGDYIDLFNALKILSVLFACIYIYISVKYVIRKYNEKSLISNYIVLISISIPALFMVRTYSLNLIFIFLYLIYFVENENAYWNNSKLYNYYKCGLIILLPFVHFLNVILLFAGIIISSYLYWIRRINLYEWRQIIVMHLIAIVLLFAYINLCNTKGKKFYKELNQFITYRFSENDKNNLSDDNILKIIPLLKKNIWSFAKSIGLKFNHPNLMHQKYSSKHFISWFYLLGIIIIIYLFYRENKIISNKNNSFIFAMFIFIFIGTLNIISFYNNHLVFFSQQYISIIYPVASLLVIELINCKYNNSVIHYIKKVYLILVFVNAMYFIYQPPTISNESLRLHKYFYIMERLNPIRK